MRANFFSSSRRIEVGQKWNRCRCAVAHHEILRLDVGVHDAARMKMLQRLECLVDDSHRVMRLRASMRCEPIDEISARNERHDTVLIGTMNG